MSVTNRFEQEFSLCGLEVMQEYEISNYVSNAAWLADNELKSTSSSINLSRYISFIDNMQGHLNTINAPTTKDNTDIEGVNFDSLKIQVKGIRKDDDVSKINVKYLISYVDNIARSLDSLYKGDLAKADIDRYTNPTSLVKVKKQCVTTTIPYDRDTWNWREIENTDFTAIAAVPLSRKYISGVYIPYIDTRPKLIAELNKTISEVKSALEKTEATLKMYLGIVEDNKAKMINQDETGSSKELTSNVAKINYFVYNSVKAAMNIASFIAYALVHKMSIAVANTIAANETHDILANIKNASAPKYESVANILRINKSDIINDFKNGSVDSLLEFAKDVVEYHANSLIKDSIGDSYDLGRAPIDYIMEGASRIKSHSPNTIYESITSKLKQQEDELLGHGVDSDDDLESMDDYKNNLSTKDIATESVNIPGARTGKEKYYALVEELMNMGEKLKPVTEAMAEYREFIGNMYIVESDAIENDSLDDFDTSENKKVLLSYLDSARVDYNKFVTDVADAMVRRVNAIDKKLFDLDSPIDMAADYAASYAKRCENDADELDLVTEMYADRYEQMTESFSDIITRCNRAYKRFMAYKESGINMIFDDEYEFMNEADDNTNNNQQNNNGPNTNAGQDNNANNQKEANANKPSSTTPTVTDNSNNDKAVQNDNNTAAPANENKKSWSDIFRGKLNSLVNSVKRWFGNLVNSYDDVTSKQGETNTAWLNEERKTYLSEKSYDGVEIEILPYNAMPFTQITDKIGGITKNVENFKNRTPDDLKALSTAKDVYKAVLGDIIPNIEWKDDTDISEVVTKYFKVGDKELATIKMSGDELKKYINDSIVPFCDQYYSTHKNTLIKATNNLKDVATETYQKIAGANNSETNTTGEKPDSTQDGKTDNNTGNKNESANTYETLRNNLFRVLTEAEEDAKNQTGPATWLDDAIKKSAQAILNAVRDRVNDYFKILGGLSAPQEAAEKEDQEKAKETNTNQA